MDIDVKNALNKVLTICESFEHNGIPVKSMVAQDTYAFIRGISLQGAAARFDLFSKLYLNNAYSAAQFSETDQTELPAALKLFCKIDALSTGTGNWAAGELISFFTILGRSYMSNAFDRKQIDVLQIADRVKQMKAYADSVATPKPAQSNTSTAAHQQKQEKPQNTEAGTAEKKNAVSTAEQKPEQSLDELLQELHDLVGLAGVKKEVDQIINLIKVRKKGEEFGVKSPPMSLHMVFSGNPGTGKTTVARKLAKIYRCLGVLSKGELVEVDRGKLVGGYVGQTAIKTQTAIDDAMGGILFIDEAYTLTHGKGENDFGQEAVDTVLKAMEDHRDDFIVIVAGYPDLMKEFIASNPGLKSRFNQYISFEDYTPEELLAIFRLECKKNTLMLSELCENYLKSYFEGLYANRSADYANGRDVRNYFEMVLRARANRLSKNLQNITYEEYTTIIPSDLEEAANNRTTI